MIKKILLIAVFFLLIKPVSAAENNKFGIHLAQPHFHDIKAAADLVNSSGGDWGYITLVIQENDRDRQKWQEIFDFLRQLHLIPIIRLATVPEGSSWRRPSKDDAKDWVEFLDSLNWVVKNRYVILFNEPNHGNEWGGGVDPADYAKVAFAFAKALKEKNTDFFVMLAGLDASAPHQPPKFWEEEMFLRELFFAARELVKGENAQENSNHRQSKGDLDISRYLPNIKSFHRDSFSNKKQITKKNIPQRTSPVNSQMAFGSLIFPKLGVINAAANQPAEIFIDSSESVLKRAFFDFLEKENIIKTILAKEDNSVNKNLFDYIDGWASHSYPNPAFSGRPWEGGRGTVRTYQWELELLKSLGVKKELPVFITETGWKHKISNVKSQMSNLLEEETTADYFKIAFKQVWLPDERVKAVTPFVLDYQSEPFLEFSWKKYQSEDFYPQYYVIQSLTKTKGEPEQIEKGEISFNLPKELVEQSTYQFKIRLKNKGQAIWEKDDGYLLSVIGYSEEKKPFDYFFSDLKNIKPFEGAEINLFLKTGKIPSCADRCQDGKVRFILSKGNKKILESKDWQFKIILLPSLKFNINLFPKLNEKGDDFEIEIFDERENIVFKKNQLKVERGVGYLKDIQNIIPGKKYRLVVLKPYYLPRQNFINFEKGENKIIFKPLIPVDFDKDGRFSLGDLKALIKNPQLFQLFLP